VSTLNIVGTTRQWSFSRFLTWHAHVINDVQRDLDLLMRRVQRGDRSAFSGVYDATAARVYGVVKRVLRDPAMSEEVTQEVFVEVWRKAATYDPAYGSVATWIVTVARRRAVDRVRREQSQRDRLAALRREPETVSVDSADLVASEMEVERVRAALATLPADQREVIELAFLEGYAHGAIAEQLGLPLGTVKGRVRGGLKRLRGSIGDAP
jgi:RNA polymerase sigma-70 factor, ECF subfamily